MEEKTTVQNPEFITIDNVTYSKYNIIFTVAFSGDRLDQVKLETYFSDTEAYKAQRLLSDKIETLVRLNLPIPLSIIYRNKDGKVITYGMINVVAINHDIPRFEEVIENE